MPKKTLQKQKTTLHSFWQRSGTPTPRVLDLPAASNDSPLILRKRSLSQTENHTQSSGHAELWNCLESQGQDSVPAAMNWSGVVSDRESGSIKELSCPVPQGGECEHPVVACPDRDQEEEQDLDEAVKELSCPVPQGGECEHPAVDEAVKELSCPVPQGGECEHPVACPDRDQEEEQDLGEAVLDEADLDEADLDDEVEQVLDEAEQDHDDKVYIKYESSSDDENFDEDEMPAEAEIIDEESSGGHALDSQWIRRGEPLDLIGPDDPNDHSGDEEKGKAPVRTFDPLSNEWQLIRMLREVLTFLKHEALSMDDMLEWPLLEQPINEDTWKLLRADGVDSLVDCFNAAIPVRTKLVFEQSKIRKADLLGLHHALSEKRTGIYVGVCKMASRPTLYCGSSKSIRQRCRQHLRPSSQKSNPWNRFYQRLAQGDTAEFRTLVAFDVPVERVKLELIEGVFIFFLGTLQEAKRNTMWKKMSTWQLYNRLTSTVKRSWSINIGDPLNANWPLATGYVICERGDSPCLNPHCHNITKSGYGLPSRETRKYLVTNDPFSGFICRVCWYWRERKGELPTAEVVEVLVAKARRREHRQQVRSGMIPGAVLKCEEEGCEAIEEPFAKVRFLSAGGLLRCPRHYSRFKAVLQRKRRSKEEKLSISRAARLLWAARALREKKVCSRAYCRVRADVPLASGKLPRFYGPEGSTLCGNCHSKIRNEPGVQNIEQRQQRVALTLQLDSLNGKTFQCGVAGCSKTMPRWPPIGSPEETKKKNYFTDTRAIRMKLPSFFSLCTENAGIRCNTCTMKKCIPAGPLYNMDELRPLGDILADLWAIIRPEANPAESEVSP